MRGLRERWRGLHRRAMLLELAVVVLGILACLALSGYFQIKLRLPAKLDSDHLFLPTMAKSYIEGHGFRLNDQLGFPEAQDWLYFPSFDLSYRLILWVETRFVHNPFLAVHGMYVVGLSAMFGFAYWTLRQLGVRNWVAAVGALSSVITPFLGFRGFTHDFIALSYAVPLGLGLALQIGLAKPEATLRSFLRQPYTIAAILIVGTSGLYYAFFTLMFTAFTAVAASIGQKRRFPLAAAGAAGGVIFVLLIFSGCGFDLPLVLTGRFAGPHRFAWEQLVYGLEVNSAMSAFRFIPWIARRSGEAVAAAPGAFVNDVGEWPTLPLTLVILCSPLAAAVGVYGGRSSRPAPEQVRQISLCALCVAFGLLFGMNGGFGYVFNLVISPEIRGDERLMPFLSFGAVVMVCAGAELAARSELEAVRRVAPALIALALAVGMAPQIGVLRKTQKTTLARPETQQWLRSVPAMLKAKDGADLRAVLELPTISWPEEPKVSTLEPYQHQLAYIFDRPGSQTRWSFGLNRKQPWFDVVDFAAGQPVGLAARARSIGFDGILVEKRGYASGEVAALQAALASCRIYDDQTVSLYALGASHGGPTC